MEKESIKTKNQYCRKVRFYPSLNHKVLLDKCFGATRYLINQALQEIELGNIKKITNSIEVRNHLKYQDKYLNDKTIWLKEIPYDTRDGAIRQLCSNFKTAFTQLKNKTISNFKMKYKSKRNAKQVCFINKNAFNFKNKTLFKTRIKDKIVFKEDIDDIKDVGTITILREKNKYYMCFPMERENINIKTPYKAVALDPGVKTFQTLYSEEGIVGKIGDNTYNDIKMYLKQEDKLKSFLSKNQNNIKKRSVYNIRKRCFLLRTKVKNSVRELHLKTCSWLTKNFKNIFLPTFSVKQMINKKYRKISKRSVRSMLSLSHFAFKNMLINMGKSRGCKITICSEAYTSKTCGNCGFINNSLGSNRTYECPICDIVIDRDYNGARNIYLRNTCN